MRWICCPYCGAGVDRQGAVEGRNLYTCGTVESLTEYSDASLPPVHHITRGEECYKEQELEDLRREVERMRGWEELE